MPNDTAMLARPASLPRLATVAYARPMNAAPDDSVLMRRYRDGDPAAFDALYHRHKDSLYRYLARMSYDRDAVDDVFQEVWGKIINARETYKPTAKFRTFLFRVARNCFIDHLRRNERHRQPSLDDVEPPASPVPEPDEQTERALLRRRLDAALADLPEAQRDAWLLHEEAGLNVDHIAQVTGVNRETAKSRLRYAIDKLRTALAENSGAGAAAPWRAGAGESA
mgnify:CR=1 FL=1